MRKRLIALAESKLLEPRKPSIDLDDYKVSVKQSDLRSYCGNQAIILIVGLALGLFLAYAFGDAMEFYKWATTILVLNIIFSIILWAVSKEYVLEKK